MCRKYAYCLYLLSVSLGILTCPLFAQQSQITLQHLDERHVIYSVSSQTYTGPSSLPLVGIAMDGDNRLIYRLAETWNPGDITDWAFILSGEMRIITEEPPAQSYYVYMRHMASDPRILVKADLYSDCGNGDIYTNYLIPNEGRDSF